jgi:hypothetical protein
MGFIGSKRRPRGVETAPIGRLQNPESKPIPIFQTVSKKLFGKPRYAPEVESSAYQTAILVPFGVLLQQKRSVEVVFSLLPNSF